MTARPRYSVVVPVYGNEHEVPALLDAVESLGARLDATLEVVFVVDGSPDLSYAVLRASLPDRAIRSTLISHSRNFGSFAAIRTGLAAATGDYFAVLAADLQEPLELVETFFGLLSADEADVAIGVRTARNDGASAIGSRWFWALYRRLVIKDIPKGGVDIFGCGRPVRDVLLDMQEANSSLVAQVFWAGFRRAEVPYERLERTTGSSGWTLRRRLSYLSDSVFSFTALPIRLLWTGGAMALAVSFLLALVVGVAYALDLIAVPGYTPLVLSLAFFSGLNAFGLGVIGSYVWRTFENTKRRPLSIVASTTTFGGAEGPA